MILTTLSIMVCHTPGTLRQGMWGRGPRLSGERASEIYDRPYAITSNRIKHKTVAFGSQRDSGASKAGQGGVNDGDTMHENRQQTATCVGNSTRSVSTSGRARQRPARRCLYVTLLEYTLPRAFHCSQPPSRRYSLHSSSTRDLDPLSARPLARVFVCLPACLPACLCVLFPFLPLARSLIRALAPHLRQRLRACSSTWRLHFPKRSAAAACR